MAAFKVVIKHQGQKYDVEVDPNTSGEEFKLQLYSLTNVEPHRQKVLLKGGQLKDDVEMGKLGLKPNQQIMMLGSPGEGGEMIQRPKDKIRFVEDMTEAEAARKVGATPAGLINLGNTCYLNSTLQTLRAIPELQAALINYEHRVVNPGDTPAALDLTKQLKHTFKHMSDTVSSYSPIAFLQALRLAFPQFAERAKTGTGYAQQDAEEAWSQIVSQLNQKLTVPDLSDGNAKALTTFVNKYMAGEFVSTLTCDDEAAKEAGEVPMTSKNTFVKLNCHIDIKTNHLSDGLKAGLEEKIEKRSEVLGRETTYTKTSEICRLPKYLTVHFVRFFWKRDTQKKAKIMRKVTFPQELDVVEYCTEDLRKALVPVRDKVREIRKDELDIERARKRCKKNPLLDDGAGNSGKKDDKKDTNLPGAGDVEMAEGTATYKTDADIEAEKQASLLAAKKELQALIDPELAKNDGTNASGLFELRGVVTHQGASADSGHYTAYVKKSARKGKGRTKEDGNWWWFNDDKVSEVTPDKIDALAGGGESHSALILLYRAITLPIADGTKAD